jgi:hypothetical protein
VEESAASVSGAEEYSSTLNTVADVLGTAQRKVTAAVVSVTNERV